MSRSLRHGSWVTALLRSPWSRDGVTGSDSEPDRAVAKCHRRFPRAVGDEGLRFTPGSLTWAVNREAVLLLGGGRALFLQLAHPLVAAGVAEHSGFVDDPFGRLFRTLNTSYAVVFGEMDSAMTAVRRMDAVHHRVRGVLRESVGAYAAGTPYDARDPALRLWVHATLFDTSLGVYERFVRRLSPAERAQYYAESRELAHVLGISEDMIPATIEEFREYISRMLSTGIAVGAPSRALARLIFRPPRARSLRAIAPLVEFVTVGLLPSDVREQYGYGWSPRREHALDTLARAIRRTLPALPSVVRVVPPARAAERRLAGRAWARQAS